VPSMRYATPNNRERKSRNSVVALSRLLTLGECSDGMLLS
jgi:hypothetical protein